MSTPLCDVGQETVIPPARDDFVAATAVPRRLSLKANFSWTFIGSTAYTGCLFGVMTVLTHWTTPETVGKYALGLAIASPAVMFGMFQLRTVQATDARDAYALADYFGLRMVAMVVVAGVVAGYALWESNPVTAWVIFWVGAGKCVDSLSDIVRGYFQKQERMDYSGISMMVKGLVALPTVALVIWWTGDIVVATAALAGMWLLTFFGYDLVQAWRLSRQLAPVGGRPESLWPRFRLSKLASLLWVAFPLGVVMFFIALQPNIPRYVLDAYVDEAAVGFFSAIVYPAVAGALVINSLGQSASPRLARYFVENLPAFRHLLLRLLGCAALLGCAYIATVVLIGRPLLRIVYGADYAHYYPEFIILAVALAVQLVSSCFGYAMTASRSFWVQMFLSGVGCSVAAVAALLLIPRWQVRGAAIAVLLTTMTVLITYGVMLGRILVRRLAQDNLRSDAERPGGADGS